MNRMRYLEVLSVFTRTVSPVDVASTSSSTTPVEA